MVGLVRRIARAFGENGIVFKDQPNGRCLECKWNEALTHGTVHCHVPDTRLVNEICIQKLTLVMIQNVDNALGNDSSSGEDWK